MLRSNSRAAMSAAFIVLAILFAAPSVRAEGTKVTVPAIVNKTCPIMGKPASSKLFVDTEKGRIYICCTPCVKKIRKNVAKAYKAAFPESHKAANKNCPLTGRKITKKSPKVELQGLQVPVCCPSCVKTAPKRAQLLLAKVKNPALKDVGNSTCPLSGKPVSQNSIVIIGDEIVRLHSRKCVSQVKKKPAGVLAKARAIRAKEKKQKPKKKDAS